MRKAILGLPTRKLADRKRREVPRLRDFRCGNWRRWYRNSPPTGPVQQVQKREKPQDPNVKAAAEALQNELGTRVRIVELSEQRGRIEIDYYSQEELDRLYQQICPRKWVGNNLVPAAGVEPATYGL